MATSLFIDLNGEYINDCEVLGYGRSGVVINCDGVAVKTPLRHPWSSDDDVQTNISVLRHEQDVYRRLHQNESHPLLGVVRSIGFQPTATQLAYMENGDLRSYLAKNKPSRTLQISWFRQMACALKEVHDRRVLIADVATRNFLLDAKLSVKLCDFSEASILPPDTNMEIADDNGYSILTDIGQLGTVIYEIIQGEPCDFDLFQDNAPNDGRAYWPQRASLPSTEDLWLGQVIERCWTKGYRNAQCLSQELDSINIESVAAQETQNSNGSTIFPKLGRFMGCVTQQLVMIGAVLGTLTIVAISVRKYTIRGYFY